MGLTVHHLACGRMQPAGGRWIYGHGTHRHLVCHCMLIELPDMLVLVDAGLGRADVADPKRRLGRGFLHLVRPRLDAADTAIAQVEARGLDPRDVRHIIVTHLDLDHIGGLADFPRAKVHAMRTEHDQAQTRPSFHDRQRYRPTQWAHGVDWVLHDVAGERWKGLQAVRELTGLPPEILLVPTVGHSAGHAAVAVQAAEGWRMHCGDAYFHRGEIDREAERCPPGLEWFQRMVAYDRRARLHNRERLRELARDHDDVTLFSAHDPHELQRMRAATPP